MTMTEGQSPVFLFDTCDCPSVIIINFAKSLMAFLCFNDGSGRD